MKLMKIFTWHWNMLFILAKWYLHKAPNQSIYFSLSLAVYICVYFLQLIAYHVSAHLRAININMFICWLIFFLF
uniref:Uncharacterized protein n=1 Tax=Oreochromis aureus TaxID=47969 RepID=A0AAZ1WVT3_OREAU